MNRYTVTIEVNSSAELTSDDVDRIHDDLDGFHVALGMSARGWRSATLTTTGENLRQAIASAVALVEAALGGTAIVCEAVTVEEFDIRQGWRPVPDLVSVAEAADILGVSRQRVLQRIQAHTLPATQVGKTYVLPRAAVQGDAE